ncbi:MAG: hypothetical protein FWG87_09475 [Defluviitaleaceae bacterium]|nr:hypothetical protein [Defluviitaleaceae bacterium]
MSKVATSPKGVLSFDFNSTPYIDMEALEAKREAMELKNNPNVKRYKSVRAMREDILSGNEDD